METDQNTFDLQRQVLQSTLDEIATRQEDATDCCVICLESISDACEAIPCQHRNFDYLCLLSWLEQSPKCPLCKAVISQVRHGLDGPIANTYTVPEPASKPQAPQIGHPRLALPTRSRRSHLHHRPYSRQPRYVTASLSLSDEIAKRRDVYRHNRYSKHVGTNSLSRYRELTPTAFCSDSVLVSRARMWIRRELQVFSFLNPDADQTEPSPDANSQRDAVARRRANNAEFLLEYIIAILKSVDIMGSAGQAEEMISDFLGRDSTRLFLHELRAWLRSPYTKLADWDRAVQYDLSAPSSPRAESGGAGSSRQAQRQSKNVGARDCDIPQGRGDFYRSQGRAQRAREVHRHEPYARPHRD
ncbi:RING finger domain protein [Fusarium sp. NRRL 52700]|nr:RING finger domain protein [Fusarium sp. NRRL 52700]